MKQPIAVCSNDDRLCYDRIVHAVAFLALRRSGIPKPMIISILYIIRMMDHNVRTSFGDSKEIYGGEDWRLPPHRNIHGKGGSPMIWAVISPDPLLAIQGKSYSGVFRAPIKNYLLHWQVFPL